MAEIGIIGDIHGDWSAADSNYFNDSAYDLLLFVGDIASLNAPWRTRTLAEMVGQVTKPALLVAGNHDVHNLVQLLAEIAGAGWMARLSGRWHARHHRRLEEWLYPVEMGGYSTHCYRLDDGHLDVVVGRPCAMGGSQLSFRRMLQEVYGVNSMEASAARLCHCVDEARSGCIIFLAHNGPTGLGDAPDDIWGRDFGPAYGDWGDQDLRAAVDYARARGKKVLAVIAGHMHLLTNQGVERPWHLVRDGIHYINAARVPRVREGGRHHIRFALDGTEVDVTEQFI